VNALWLDALPDANPTYSRTNEGLSNRMMKGYFYWVNEPNIFCIFRHREEIPSA